jgi:hypothetical protein
MRSVNLFACVTALAAAGAGALTDADILHRLEALEVKNAEVTAKYAEMAAKYAEIKGENAEIQAKNAEIKSTLSATTAGAMKEHLIIVKSDDCPEGYMEADFAQGMMLTGRPKNGKTGATFNRPFDAGEEGRTPAHSHEVTVTDPGHYHVNTVNDPGHLHQERLGPQNGGTGPGQGCYGSYGDDHNCDQPYPSKNSTTGIVVDSLLAKSSVSVSIDANDAGEGYPLVYVLICQQVLGN